MFIFIMCEGIKEIVFEEKYQMLYLLQYTFQL